MLENKLIITSHYSKEDILEAINHATNIIMDTTKRLTEQEQKTLSVF